MDYQLLVMFAVPFILASLAVYFAWFRADSFQEYLRWNSQVFGRTPRGQTWLASKYYFWLMRGVVTCLFVITLIGMIIALREAF